MERWIEWFDDGGGVILDEYIYGEYWQILNISSIYVPLRTRWRFINLARPIICILVVALSLCLYTITAFCYSLKDVDLAVKCINVCTLMLIALSALLSLPFLRRELNTLFSIEAENVYIYSTNSKIEGLELWQKEIRRQKIIFLALTPIFYGAIAFLFIGGTYIDNFFGYKKETNFKNIDTRLPLDAWHPWSMESTTSFVLLCLLQCATAFICGVATLAIFIMFIFNSMTLILQLKILLSSIRMMKERSKTVFDNMKVKRNDPILKHIIKSYQICIKENVEHHLAIIRLFKIICACVFWPSATVLYGGSLSLAISLAAFLYGDFTPSNFITSFLLLLGMLASIGLVCYFGQEITDTSGELRSALYDIDWIALPKEVKLSISIMTEMSKKPLVFKALGITPLSYETFTGVLNRAYSYFNIVRAARSEGV